MRHELSISFAGDVDAALELGTSVLMTNGFKIVRKERSVREFSGPGMNSSRENPLRGASRVRLEGRKRELSLDAELGGVKRMAWIVVLIPVVIVAILAALQPEEWGRMALIILAPWVVVSPTLIFWIRRRTRNELNTLLHNMAMSAERSA